MHRVGLFSQFLAIVQGHLHGDPRGETSPLLECGVILRLVADAVFRFHDPRVAFGDSNLA